LKPLSEFDLAAIGSAFDIRGKMVDADRYGTGHINDTFAVTYLHGEGATRYIHQRINRHVFADTVGLMDNVRRVTSHLRGKLTGAGGGPAGPGVSGLHRRVLTLVPKLDGSVYHIDDDGWMWRTYFFIERAQSYDMVRSPELAFEAAKAFGAFQEGLVDLPEPRLNETIPDFHHTPRRFAALQAAVDADVENRAAGAAEEVEFVASHEAVLGRLLAMQDAGEIPERVTHNDTKLNNVMIDEDTAKAVCVIDLDTVMPGLALFDFGDMVRTSTSFSKEDELDLSKVQLQMPLFEALVRGYLQSAGSFLAPVEMGELVFAGKLITLEIGMRFLTDYLAGDTYFKTHKEGHNLDRCRAQFRLVESINENWELMQQVVENVAAERPWEMASQQEAGDEQEA
jgi:aminoglycoside phosphotransferase (APT) family kinase protein